MTDDRKARRMFGEFMPDVPLVSTLDLMKLWADERQVPCDELRAAMDAMRSSASAVLRNGVQKNRAGSSARALF